MTWSPYLPYKTESSKIWPHVIPYTRGTGLDIGCGLETCLPHMIGVDTGDAFGRGAAAVHKEAHELFWIANGSLDFIFSSHLLEHFPKERVPEILEIWGRKIRRGGHLVLYLPHKLHYPNVGKEGANPDHKWDPLPIDIIQMMSGLEHKGWHLIENETRAKFDEYSFFQVYRKVDGSRLETIERRPPGDSGRAIVFRLGAIGDCIVASSVCRGLREEGYDVTFLTSKVGEEVLRHHPYINEIIVADREQFPQTLVGTIVFPGMLKERYDRVVNLDKSLEGLILQREEGYPFDYPQGARNLLFGGINYTEAAHAIADVEYDPDDLDGYFATPEEIKWATDGRKDVVGKLVLWQIAGSGFFKVYPAANRVIKRLAEEGVNVIMSGEGDAAQKLEGWLMKAMIDAGISDTGFSHLYPRVNQWTLRQTLAMAHCVDCVIGPETGVLNAVAQSPVPKVIYLSHSSAENLTRDWRNVQALTPDIFLCECYPCHQVHLDESTCNMDLEKGGARCMTALEPDVVYRAVMDALYPDIPF